MLPVRSHSLPPRVGLRVVALGLALLALATACSRSSYVYVASSDHKAYFKVPGNWTLFGKRDMLVGSGQNASPAIDAQNKWLIGMDSSPEPDVRHIVIKELVPSYPVVFAQMVSLAPSEQDQLSLIGMRNYYYKVDEFLNTNRAGLLRYHDVVLDGGFHGSQMVYDLFGGGAGDVSASNVVLRVNQTILVDAATKTLYVLIVRCESHCYRDNKALIDSIADSWTVKER
jgi:hypothetical protein